METKWFFQFEIIINVFLRSFQFIWTPMLWVYGHYKLFYSYSAGIDFRRQTSYQKSLSIAPSVSPTVTAGANNLKKPNIIGTGGLRVNVLFTDITNESHPEHSSWRAGFPSTWRQTCPNVTVPRGLGVPSATPHRRTGRNPHTDPPWRPLR